jgi:hypothetical protein
MMWSATCGTVGGLEMTDGTIDPAATCLLLKPIARHGHRFRLKRTAHRPEREQSFLYRMYRLLLEHSGEKKIGPKNPDISLNYKEETLEKKVCNSDSRCCGESTPQRRPSRGARESPERCVDSSIRSKTKTAESYR